MSAPPTATAPAPNQAAAPAFVRIHDRRIFAILVAKSGQSPQQRAEASERALESIINESDAPTIRVEENGAVAVVYAGSIPVIQLGIEDALASGDATVAVHADAIAGRLREGLRAERQRSAISRTVFSFALIIVSALVAFLLYRKLDELVEKFRRWMEDHPDRLPILHVKGIEVVRPLAVRGGINIALTIAKRATQVGIGYAWVLISLSLFESTRGYTQRLTGVVLTPLSALMGRVASALPAFVIAFFTVLVVGGALRFVRLFFGTVARGETTVAWVPPDLAHATSILIRAGIVVVTLVVAAPLLTGTDDGALSRVGVVALAAIGVASTPLLSTAAMGVVVMFGRQLRVGEYASIGGREGRIRGTSLLDVVLEDEDGCEVHVPHVLGLWHPTRLLGATPPVCIEICVAEHGDLGRVTTALEACGGSLGGPPRIEVISVDAGGTRIRVSMRVKGELRPREAKNRLFGATTRALHAAGVRLGHTP